MTVIYLLVVDQIDDGLAAVEVNGRATAWLSVDLLPAGVREGDRLSLHVAPIPPFAEAMAPRPDAHSARLEPAQSVQE